jgi:hypothetical protein
VTPKQKRRAKPTMNDVARAWVEKHKLLYCRHWRGHFCEICSVDSLELLLNKVHEAGRADMSDEIFKHVQPVRR